MRARYFLLLFIFLGVWGCGKLNQSDATGGAGSTGSVGNGRAVVKDGSGNTVAHLVQFTAPRIALLYLVDSQKYAFIDLATGEYTSSKSPANNVVFSFSGASCSGNAVVDDDWAGPMGTVFFVANRYLEVTGTVVSGFSYVSQVSTGHFFTDENCSAISNTTADAFALTEVSRPYDFEAIAPLTITYE